MASDSRKNLILASATTSGIVASLSFRFIKSLILSLINAVLILFLAPVGLRRRSGALVDQRLFKQEKEMLEVGGVHKRKVDSVLRVSAGIVNRKNNPLLNNQLIGPGALGLQTRRALAIKQVMMDDGGFSTRMYSLFTTSRGYTLFTQSWTPLFVEVKGIIILLHGLNEHSGRYDTFAKQLNSVGFKVYAMDWIGHGGSDGLHAYVHSLDDTVEDAKDYLYKVVADNPGLPCFCFGHSTGAAIVLKVVLDPKAKDLVAGIVLTSPVIKVEAGNPVLALLASVLSLLLPKYQLDSVNKPETIVSRDPDALMGKYSDPLVFTGSIRVRTGAEILRICTYLQQNLRKITTRFLVLHGTADTITEPEGSQKFYQEASSTDKSIKLYDGLLHDLLFEPEKKVIEQDIIDWLNSKLQT